MPEHEGIKALLNRDICKFRKLPAPNSANCRQQNPESPGTRFR